MREVRSGAAAFGYLLLGHALLGLGLVALVVPIVPTTPFLLLAAASYARGSVRFHTWLIEHRWFGPPIRNFREGRGVTRRARALAIGGSLLGLAGSLLWVARGPWTRAAALAMTALFVYGVLRLPNADRRED